MLGDVAKAVAFILRAHPPAKWSIWFAAVLELLEVENVATDEEMAGVLERLKDEIEKRLGFGRWMHGLAK